VTVPIPTSLFVASTNKVFVSTVTFPVTVRDVKVPTEVMFPWAAVVTVPAVVAVLALPVTLPVNGPEKAVAVTVPTT